ncbi:MAG: hypothetical protein MK110_09755 [Fuerstiella sp.]|nr:hypothetical protein [Fuerstiella sp.]
MTSKNKKKSRSKTSRRPTSRPRKWRGWYGLIAGSLCGAAIAFVTVLVFQIRFTNPVIEKKTDLETAVVALTPPASAVAAEQPVPVVALESPARVVAVDGHLNATIHTSVGSDAPQKVHEPPAPVAVRESLVPPAPPNINLDYEIGPPHTDVNEALRTAVYQVPVQSNIIPIAAAGKENGDTPIVFNFENAPWNLVLRQFCERAGMAMEMKAQPSTLFTYRDDQPHTVNDALDILNGFLIRDGFVLMRHGRLMLLVATDNIPLHLIDSLPVEELNTRSRFELVSVEVKVNEVPVVEMAQQLQPLLSPLGKIVPLTSAYRLVVTDLREKVQEILKFTTMTNKESAEVTSEVVQLRNIKAEDVVQSLQQTMGSNVTVVKPGQSPVSPRRTSPVVSVVETNALVIKGRPIELARIRNVIADLDRSPAQVHIQALLVEVELADTDEFGVEVGIQDSLLFRRSIVDDVLTITESTADPGTGIITTTENIISQVTNPGFNFNGVVPGNNTAQNPGRLAGQALANLSVGRTNPLEGHGGLVLSAGNESLSILLRALAANRKVNVLSRPTIRTVHNRPASIQMGAQVPVVDGVSVSPNGSANPVVRQDKAGIILEVTPKISDRGLIFMEVRAEKSEFRSGPGSGTPIFTDASSGNVIEAPIKDVTEAIATVNLSTGQTIVLGGMITSGRIESKRKVPVLGDMPILGPLFRYEFFEERRKELLIFLTPEIVHDDAESFRISHRELTSSSIELTDLDLSPETPEVSGGHTNILYEDAQPLAPEFKPMGNWNVPRLNPTFQTSNQAAQKPQLPRTFMAEEFLNRHQPAIPVTPVESNQPYGGFSSPAVPHPAHISGSAGLQVPPVPAVTVESTRPSQHSIPLPIQSP